MYRARPKKGEEKVKRNSRYKKDSTAGYQSIGLDLSKASRDLLSTANTKIQAKFPGPEDDGQCYAFADINCNLRIKLAGNGEKKKFLNFSNESELEKILADL